MQIVRLKAKPEPKKTLKQRIKRFRRKVKNKILLAISSVAFLMMFVGFASVDCNPVGGAVIALLSLLWLALFTSVNDINKVYKMI